MLALIGVDAIAASLVAELEGEGLLPRLAELRQRAAAVQLSTPAATFPAGAFPTLWSGVPIEEHGVYYPFMWDAAGMRVRYGAEFPSPPALWERVSQAGGRVVVVDPYEATPPGPVNGLVISGWQFANRVVLRPWTAPTAARRGWERRLGRGRRVEEVFGEPDERSLRRLASVLVAAPARAAALVEAALPEVRPDVMVVSLPAVHLGGHQLWDPGAVVSGISPRAAGELQGALRQIAIETDRALGAIVDVLPPGSDVVVFSSLGMAAETSRTDVLGTMLSAILSGAAVDDRGAAGSWRLRASVPASVRARVARTLPDSVATSVAARLELRGVDWSSTRAFPVPSDTNGAIRFNVCGRERDGVVAPEDVPGLVEEIRAGLESFTLDGQPVAASVESVPEALGVEQPAALLPDLIVRWLDRPARRGEVLHAPRFGTIHRHGVGSGRSGNHTPDAWALVAPALGAPPASGRRDLCDIAATAYARFGLECTGQSLVEPAR
jgi:hypothetical protein